MSLAIDLAKGVVGLETSAEKAARKASELQAKAGEAGIAEQRRQFDVTQESLRPFQEAGVSALGQQQALLGLSGQEAQQAAFTGLQESPGQKFIRERQQRSLLRGAAAVGQRLGGNVLTALQEQGTGFAQQDIENQFGRLGQLAGQGQNAATNIGQFGAQKASNIQQGITSTGQARASGILGSQQAKTQQQQQLLQLGAAFFSDPKLKSNRKIIGNKNGHNIWSWTWNELAESIGLFGNDTGVMANEVKKKNPEAVGMRDGFMTVNYSMIGV